MSAKHTKGPWIYVPDGEFIEDEHGDAVADMFQSEAGPVMAAAPDLYDALLEFAEQYRCGCAHPACKNCERDRMTAAAIAKAKGEA